MKKRKLFLLSMLFLALLIPVMWLYADALRNSWKLYQMENQFGQLEHPPGTEQLSCRSKVGVFGNGNHCDFFVGAIRSYTGSKGAIEAFYMKEFRTINVYGEVHFIEDNLSEIMCCYFRTLGDWGIARAPGQNLYLVKFFRNEPPNNDMRCH
jgi:hypothetical protein